ncbi:protein phosphatase 2C domain-containing protein [Actinospica sp.]|uniref:protein phosphatase 2C domain-containing protein n=1 Tax=Actinospica sp. TaxID=1872142 RepID=UPI002CA80E89|nr:protein phosphatase 2C domain-containing protein [Actinospica sp.]HWG22622.1 protein phosphatase 2C domain-containing protein [Actinospica sp.]
MAPKQLSGQATGGWTRIAVQPPSVAFEPGPPRQSAYDVPDTECEGWSTDRFTLRAASVRGDSHRWPRRAKPRQDCVRATVHERTGTLVFAVADGVSGAVHSEYGSREACRSAIETLIDQLERNRPIDLGAVVLRAVARLTELTQWRLGMQPNESPGIREISDLFATTLVTGIVQPMADGVVLVDVCRVGDSGAWVLDRTRAPYDAELYTPLFSSKTGSGKRFVSNRVAALPQLPAELERTQVQLSELDTLLVGTDGFGDPLGDGDGQFGALFAEQLSSPPALLWFAHVLDFSRETFDDDRTLLAMWPTRPGERR